ncbi:MAG: hemolysin family protein [Bacteroidales bacterium]|nr:hemolysin family protein [Bacteroidales bacterium]
MSVWIIISVVSLALSALFSGVEIAFVTADRVRVEIDVKRSGLIGRILNKFYSNSEFFISSILVGNNVVLVFYGMGLAALLNLIWFSHTDLNEGLQLTLQTLISTGIILLIGEFLPKTIFRINPNNSLKVFAIPVYIFYILLYPLSMFSTWLSRILMRLVGIKGQGARLRLLSVGDLNDYLEETIDTMEEKKEEVENEVKLFQNALDFSTIHLRDCMTPRNEIVAVDITDTTTEELCEMFTRTGRSKIVVYRDDIDNIIGYIHVSELFDPKQDWKEHIKEVVFAPETLLANKMMRRLLQEKRSMAVVVDEFGGVAGLVTLEDLVEEIFGDIQDEHDKQKLIMRQTGEGIYEVSGRCEVYAINEAFNLDLPEDDEYQTIAGYLLSSTGTIPAQGETVVLNSLAFKILKKSATRLELIQISPA